MFIDDEYLRRKVGALRTFQFGIPFLDDALNGIRSNDLIVFAAKTGAGKTEVGTMIANQAAKQGKKVVMLALEAETDEICRRIKYQILCEKFFSERDKYPPTIRISFLDWLTDKYGDQLNELDSFANEEYLKRTENLIIQSPTTAWFSKTDFTVLYENYVEEGADLIVLDHIHYLSPEDKENEYDHIKKIMWGLRDLINKHSVPVVALSHLRKEDKRDQSLTPCLEDIHGSSEITKQANHVISLSSLYKLPKKENYEEFFEAPPGTTACRILKTRVGHPTAPRYIAVMKFNIETKTYEDSYVPYSTDKWGTTLNPMKFQDFEYWMGLAREAKL